MLLGKRIAGALVIAVLLMSSVSGSVFAAKAPDPEPPVICFAFMGIVVCR
jgi:hypothetical protein